MRECTCLPTTPSWGIEKFIVLCAGMAEWGRRPRRGQRIILHRIVGFRSQFGSCWPPSGRQMYTVAFNSRRGVANQDFFFLFDVVAGLRARMCAAFINIFSHPKQDTVRVGKEIRAGSNFVTWLTELCVTSNSILIHLLCYWIEISQFTKLDNLKYLQWSTRPGGTAGH